MLLNDSNEILASAVKKNRVCCRSFNKILLAKEPEYEGNEMNMSKDNLERCCSEISELKRCQNPKVCKWKDWGWKCTEL